MGAYDPQYRSDNTAHSNHKNFGHDKSFMQLSTKTSPMAKPNMPQTAKNANYCLGLLKFLYFQMHSSAKYEQGM